MKLLLCTLFLGLSSTSSFAQNCDGFYLLQNGKTITMTNYGKKDKLVGKVVYKIASVKKVSGTINANVQGQIFDEKDKLVSTNESNVSCSGGQYKMDLRMMMNEQQLKQMKNYNADVDFTIDYPNNMKVGDVLKNAQFSLDAKSDDGLNGKLDMKIEQRTVVAEETVTTTAGTWKCYKITSHIVMKAIVGGIGIPFSIDNTEWFAPSFGIVKTQTKMSRSEITAIQ